MVKGGEGGWRGEFMEIHFDNTTKYHCNIKNRFGLLFDGKERIEPYLCSIKLI